MLYVRHPDEIDDPLTKILRAGAQQLLAQAIEMEADSVRHLTLRAGAFRSGRAVRRINTALVASLHILVLDKRAVKTQLCALCGFVFCVTVNPDLFSNSTK
jgi:hypothetical protein